MKRNKNDNVKRIVFVFRDAVWLLFILPQNTTKDDDYDERVCVAVNSLSTKNITIARQKIGRLLPSGSVLQFLFLNLYVLHIEPKERCIFGWNLTLVIIFRHTHTIYMSIVLFATRIQCRYPDF